MNTTEALFAGLVPCTHKLLNQGEALFHQGSPVEMLYVIRQGRVKLVRSTLDGNVAILQMAMSGDVLAEASLFSDVYHCTSKVESKTAELSCFSRTALLTACQQSITATMQLTELFAHRIRKLRAIMEIRNIRSAKQRIYAYFQLEAGAGDEVAVSMTYKDMAYQIGLAHETFYRAMKQLERENIIVKKECIIQVKAAK